MKKISSYLNEVTEPPEFALSCGCKGVRGAWRVQLGEKLYAFTPSTQMQKDTWLGGAKKLEDKLARQGALRWHCGGCGTLQLP